MRINRIHSLLLFTLFFLSYGTHAQVTYSEFLNENDIHRKTELGLELWNVFLRSDMDSVKVVAVELLMDASEKENEFARAVGTRILGSHLFRSGKIDQGLEYLISSRDYFEKNEDYVTSSELYNEVGHALLLKGEYDEAIVAYRKSIQFGKKSTDPTAEFNGELGLGKAYISKGDTSVGLNFVMNYKRLAIEQKKYEAAADALAYIAQIESDKRNESISNEYYFRSLSYSKKSKSKIHLSHSYANMGILKFYSLDYDSSLYYFKASLELRKELNNPKAIVEGLYNLGFFYMSIDDLDLALDYLVKARELANRNGFLRDEIDAITDMVDVYKNRGDTSRANVLLEEKMSLENQLKEQSGIDDGIIESIDLSFSGKKKDEIKPDEDGVGWKELTIAILIIGLIIFFLSERSRIS